MITAEKARAIKSVRIDFANGASIVLNGASCSTGSIEISIDGNCNLSIQNLRWTRENALNCVNDFANANRGEGLLSKEIVEKLLNTGKGE